MVKYLKVSLSDAYHLIPIQSILGIEVGANTEVKILTHNVGHTATAADAAKTKEQLNSIVDAIEDALQTSWTNPYYLLEPKYAITAIAQIEEEWSA